MLLLAGFFSLEVYGRSRIGSMLGLERAIVGVGAATGPILVGASVDVTGSYAFGLTATAALWVAAIALLLTVPRAR